MLTLLPSAWVTLGNLSLPQLSTCLLSILSMACGGEPGQSFPNFLLGAHLPGFCQICEKGARVGVSAEAPSDLSALETHRASWPGVVYKPGPPSTPLFVSLPTCALEFQQDALHSLGKAGAAGLLGILQGTDQGLELSSQFPLMPKV